MIGLRQCSRDEFAPISTTPDIRLEVIAEFSTPAGIEGIIVQTASTYGATGALQNNSPGRKTVFLALSLMRRYALTAVFQRCVSMHELHRLRVAEKFKQAGSV